MVQPALSRPGKMRLQLSRSNSVRSICGVSIVQFVESKAFEQYCQRRYTRFMADVIFGHHIWVVLIISIRVLLADRSSCRHLN